MYHVKNSKNNRKIYFEFSIILLLILMPFIIFQDRLYVITSQSMAPTINTGDLIIRGDKEPEDIKVGEEEGDILILRGPEYFYKKGFDPVFWGNLKDVPIIHRAIEKVKIGNKWYFKTKGDNNLVADGGYKFINKTDDYDYFVIEYNDSNVIYISETEVLGIVLIIIPYVGYLSIFFPLVLVLVIGIFLFYLILKILKYEIKIVKVTNETKK